MGIIKDWGFLRYIPGISWNEAARKCKEIDVMDRHDGWFD